MASSSSEVAVVLGTRPEIIKLAPVIEACQRRDVEFNLVHTGQHYSECLNDVFFTELGLLESDYNLGVGSNTHGRQTAEMMIELESPFEEMNPDIAVVQGDTNSVLACALVTGKRDTTLAHVEAGLRSFDESMPEEINRVLTDHVSDFLFAPTPEAETHLLKEGIDRGRIHVTGNTIVDALCRFASDANSGDGVLEKLDVSADGFYLLTLHREENVDDSDTLADLLGGVARFADGRDAPVIYPIHPRTRENIDRFDLTVPGSIRLVEPVSFLEFVRLERTARLAFTDSGGVQEECCILGTPCVTLRDSTERSETVDVGANVLAGIDPAAVVDAAKRMEPVDGDWTNPLGDGTAGEQIVDVLCG